MKYVFSLLLLAVLACATPERKEGALARVGEKFLFADDLQGLVPPGTSKEDSVLLVRQHIERWALRRLLTDAAERNLGKQKAALDTLVSDYRRSLYVNAYLEEVVKQSVDTVVAESEMQAFYEENKSNFKTNKTLLRLRYVRFSKDHPRRSQIRSKFFDMRPSDQKFWDTYGLQFKSFALNDSVWVGMENVYSRLPFITPENQSEYIRSGKSIEHTDSTDVFLVKIRAVLGATQIGPYTYFKPTIKEVILNQRKLQLIKKFEKDITHDAIKDKNYEIYK